MIKAYISGVEYELNADYSISEQAANKIASDISVIIDRGQPIPKSGEIIEIRDDEAGEMYFLGICGIPKSPQYNSPYDVKIYSITCGNANSILSRRVANAAFKGYTITQIVQALFDRYVSAEGFTLGGISEIPIKLNIYTAADYGLQYCLDELAEYVSGAWYCTNDRKFYFTAKDDFLPFPRAIDKDFIPITGLEVKVKDTDMRTSQIISGGKSETAEQCEDFVYNGEENNFVVSFAVSRQPTILINAVAVPPERIGVKGLNDNDNAFMFLFSFDSSVISYNTLYVETSPSPLQTGDAVQIRYVGLFPIRAIVQNTDAIEDIAKRTGTSGIIENVKLDKSVRDIDDAVQLGNTLLKNYGATRTELKGWFTVCEAKAMGLTFEDFQLLKRWTFNLPEYGAVGDFVLTERTLTPFIKGGGIDNLKISLKLVDRAYLQSYGQVFEELSKAVSQLSIREDDVIVDVETSIEGSMQSETQLVEEFTGYMVLYCTSEAQFETDGQIASPTGLSIYAFNSATGV